MRSKGKRVERNNDEYEMERTENVPLKTDVAELLKT